MNTKDLKKYVIDVKSNLEDCLKKLQKNKYKNIFVTNNGKYVGSISDGDIRRGLIENRDLTIKNITNLNSHFLKKNEILNKKIPEFYELIPVINNQKKIITIIVNKSKKQDNFNFDAIIMAGGKGSRLKPYTLNKPKAMIKFKGREIIFHIIKKIQKAKPNKIFVSTKHKANQIENYIKRKYKMNIHCIKETKKLGTFGALSLLSKNKISDNIIIFNCDVITDLNLSNLINYHKERRSDITICATKEKLKIPYGIITKHSKNKSDFIIEKPDFHFWVNSGIYIIKKNMLDYFKFNQKIDSVKFINKLHKLNKKINYFPMFEKWMDMGTFKNILKANKMFKNYVQ